MWAALMATLLFCVSAVSATRTARVMGGTEANFWRLVVALVVLALWAHLFGSGMSGAALPLFLLSGFIGFGIGDVALFQALPRLGSRLTSLLVHCLAAPFAAVCEWLTLGTAMTAAEIFCVTGILSGVALALAPTEHLHLDRKVFWPGLLFGVLAAFGQGAGAVLSRHAFAAATAAGENIDGLSAAYQRIIAGVVVGGVCLLLVKGKYVLAAARIAPKPAVAGSAVGHSAKWRGIWLFVVINALAGPSIGVGFFQWALKTTPSGIVLPIVATMPLMIIPFAAWAEGEKPTRRSLLGGGLAVYAAVLLAMVRSQS